MKKRRAGRSESLTVTLQQTAAGGGGAAPGSTADSQPTIVDWLEVNRLELVN